MAFSSEEDVNSTPMLVGPQEKFREPLTFAKFLFKIFKKIGKDVS